jgi:hypothetical protein
MQKFAGSCSPEQLHTLQKMFDLIWMELRASTSSTYSGPSGPDALRNEIARRVLGNYKGAEVDADQITERVLSSFGIETGILRPTARGRGALRRDAGANAPKHGVTPVII